MTEQHDTDIELAEMKEALNNALAANRRLSNQLAQQTVRYQEQMRPHLRNSWMKGHNAGFWNGRETADDDLTKQQSEVENLARGLADCPYIKDPDELKEVAAQYRVLGVGNGDD